MCEPLPKQTLALRRMVERRHTIFSAIHPFDWKPGGCMAYTSFADEAEFERYVDRHRDDAWINEVVLPTPERDMLAALGVSLPPPRMCFDIDWETNGEADFDTFAALLAGAKEMAQLVFRRCLRDGEFVARFIDIDGSRQKGKRYKHSIHLVAANVALQNWADGRNIVALMDEQWRETRPDADALPLDRGVYTRFRTMRVQGSRKEKGNPGLRGEGAFSDSLITRYTSESRMITTESVQNMCGATGTASTVLGKRQRVPSTSLEPGGKALGENHRDVCDLQSWLDMSALAHSLGWTGARVLEACKMGEFIFYKVGFDEKGRGHTCMGGSLHRGNANQSWPIRLTTATCELHSACWHNGKFEMACQSANGCLQYLPLADMYGKRVKLL